MVNENDAVDLEAGNSSPQGLADETIFDFEHCSSDLDGEKRTPRGGLIASSIFTCTSLSIIAVLIWAVVTSIPKSDSRGSVEPAAAAMYSVSTNISNLTPNMMVTGESGNNSAPNSMFSFAGTANGTTSASLEVRSLPPTRYCDANSDCDWAHMCSDGTCKPGCESQDDCRPGHKCKKGLCYRRAYCFPRRCDKECLNHFYICKKNRECCSGMCMRSTRDKRFKVCQIGTRQGRREGSNAEEQEEEEGEKVE